MPGSDHHDAPPAGVPDEFAATYRDAYLRALEAQAAEDLDHDRVLGQGTADDTKAVGSAATLAGAGSPRVPTTDRLAQWRRSRCFLPAVAAVAVVALLGTAFGLGRAFSRDGGTGSAGAMAPRSSRTTASTSTRPAAPGHAAVAPGGWTGPVREVAIGAIAADCTAPPAVDAGGHEVGYAPQNAIDGRADTAWRCTGTAVGQQLVLRLAGETDVAEVGLIPGYAKTDPVSGADRYAENNRITRVRWTLANGVTVVQQLDPDPSSRAVQLLRVPRTTTDTVRLEVLAVRKGPRNTTAISEIRLAAAN